MGNLPKSVFSDILPCIVFFVSLAGCIAAVSGSCVVDQGQSLGDIKRMPEQYDYVCSNPLMLNFGNFSCAVAVDRLCVTYMINNTAQIESILRDDAERQEFAEALSYLRNASYYVIEANNKRNGIFGQLYTTCHPSEEPAPQDNAAIALAANSPIMNYISLLNSVDCAVFSNLYQFDADAVLYNTEFALSYSSKAINKALDSLQDETDTLYCMGAGDLNYTGPERATYTKIRDIIMDSRVEVDTHGSYSSLSKKLAVLSKNSWNMFNYFYTTDQTCSASAMINSSLSEKGTFAMILEIYREVRNAEESMDSLYRIKEEMVRGRIVKVKSDIATAQNQGYGGMSPYEINFFLSSWEQGLEEFPDPARLLMTVSETTYTGIGDNAESLHKQAVSIYNEGKKFHVSGALRYLSDADDKLGYSERKLTELDDLVDILLSDAENKTAGMREQAMKARDEFRLTKLTADASNFAAEKWDLAEQRYTNLRTMPKGQQLHEYYLAYQDFKASYDATKKTYLQDAYSRADSDCNTLSQVMGLADYDGLDTAGADIIHRAAVSQINRSSISGNITEIYLAGEFCRNETIALYSLASSKYQYLLEKRMTVAEAISLLKSAGQTDSKSLEEFSNYEGYIYTGNFSNSALGNYKKIDALYNKIMQYFNERKASIFGTYFASHTYVKEGIVPSVIYADQTAEVIINIEIRNAMSFSNNDSFSYKITSVGLGPEDNVTTSSSAIDVTGDSSGLNIFFKNSNANTYYYIMLKKKEKVVISSSSAWSRTLLDTTELRERRTFDLTVTRDAGNIILNVPYSRRPDACEAFLDGMRYVAAVDSPANSTTSTVSATFKGAKKGKTSGYFDCYTANPMTITRTNYTIENSSVVYQVLVKSNIGNLDKVDMSFNVASPVEGESVRVYLPTGYLADGMSYKKYGDEYLIKWQIPSLSNNIISYRIVLQTSDTANYAQKRRDEVAAKASSAGFNISLYLDRADAEIRTLQYKEALNTLSTADRLTDEYISAKIKRDALSKQASALSGMMNDSLIGTSALNEAGLTDISIEIDKKKNDFDEKMQQFISALDDSSPDKAASLLRDMEKLSDLKTIDTMLYAKETEVFDDLNKLKTSLLNLDKVKDMSQSIDELKAMEPKISLLGKAISDSDYPLFASILSEIKATISRVSETNNFEKERLEDDVSEKLASIDLVNSAWKDLKSKIAKAIEVGDGNPGMAGNLSDVEASISEMNSLMSGLNAEYASFKKMDANEIVDNIDRLDLLQLDISSANRTLNYLKALEGRYRGDAEATFSLGRTALEGALAELSDEDKGRASQLTAYLGKARNSYETGQYLDSMLYSDYVRKSADTLKRKTTVQFDPMVILLGLIVLASAALAALLLRKDRPKEAKVVEKVQD